MSAVSAYAPLDTTGTATLSLYNAQNSHTSSTEVIYYNNNIKEDRSSRIDDAEEESQRQNKFNDRDDFILV